MGKKSKQVGNRFQEDFFMSIPKDLHAERYKDSPTKFKNVANPADFWINAEEFIVLVECKSTNDASLPINNIRMDQVWKMVMACVKRRTYGGFLINFRRYDKTYYVPLGEFLVWYVTRRSASIPHEWIKNHGYRVAQRLTVTRWRYGVQGLLDWIREGKINDIR